MWYVNWGAGSSDADGSMRSILHSDSFPDNGRYNTAFWSNPEFDKLLDDALVSTDTDEIAKMYAEAQSIAWEECPWMFLGNDNTINASQSYVEGIRFKPGGDILFQTAKLVQ